MNKINMHNLINEFNQNQKKKDDEFENKSFKSLSDLSFSIEDIGNYKDKRRKMRKLIRKIKNKDNSFGQFVYQSIDKKSKKEKIFNMTMNDKIKIINNNAIKKEETRNKIPKRKIFQKNMRVCNCIAFSFISNKDISINLNACNNEDIFVEDKAFIREYSLYKIDLSPK